MILHNACHSLWCIITLDPYGAVVWGSVQGTLFLFCFTLFFFCILLYFFFVFVENHIELEASIILYLFCVYLYLLLFFCICLKITVARRCEAWDGRASTGGGGGQRWVVGVERDYLKETLPMKKTKDKEKKKYKYNANTNTNTIQWRMRRAEVSSRVGERLS